MKLKQTSFYQTGIAIMSKGNEEIIQVPLFSGKPTFEAHEFAEKFNMELLHVFYTNTTLGTEKELFDFIKKYEFLPRNLMEDMRCGFSHIYGSYGATYYPTLYYS